MPPPEKGAWVQLPPTPEHAYPVRSTQYLPGLWGFDRGLDISDDLNHAGQRPEEIPAGWVHGYELRDRAALLSYQDRFASCTYPIHDFEAFCLELTGCHCLHDHLHTPMVILYMNLYFLAASK